VILTALFRIFGTGIDKTKLLAIPNTRLIGHSKIIVIASPCKCSTNISKVMLTI